MHEHSDHIRVQLTGELFTSEASGDEPRRYRARLWEHGEQTRDWRKLSFRKGGLVDSQEPVTMLLNHMAGAPGFFAPPSEPFIVGYADEFNTADDGLWADFHWATTPEALKIKQLVDDKALRKVSGGISITKYERDEENETIEALEYEILEVSVVVIPAMRSADIERNQLESQLVTLANEGETNMPDTDDTALTDLTASVAELQDTIRTLTEAAEPVTVTGTPRCAAFASVGDIVADVVAMDRNRDAGATDRLSAMLDAGDITRGPGGATLINVFAFGNPGDSGDALSGGEYVDDLLRLLRDPQVSSRFFQSGDLDSVPGPTVPKREVTQGGLVDYVEEGTSIVPQNQVWGAETYPKVTLAGGQGVTIQARDWSDPNYMTEVVEDLVSAYGEKLNFESVRGDGIAGPPAHMAGIFTAQPDRISAIGSDETAQAKAFVAAIGASKASVYSGSRQWPGVFVAGGDVYGMIDGWTDADGRPLLATDGPFNAIGVENGPVPVGRIRGLTCYADDAVAPNHAYIASFRNAKLWQSSGAPAQVALLYPDQLTIDVSIYGYSAMAIRRPGSFAVIEGIGEVTATPAATAKTAKAKK